MIYGVYSIRDAKTGFMSPVIEVNDAAAARNFFHSVSTSEGILFTYASDFSLYLIGKFDSDSGVLEPAVPRILVAEGSHALRVLKEEAEKDG